MILTRVSNEGAHSTLSLSLLVGVPPKSAGKTIPLTETAMPQFAGWLTEALHN